MKQRRLTDRSKIAIVAPSGAIAAEHLEKGVSVLRSLGYDVELMPHVVGHTTSVFSAPDALRACDLTEALTREDVDVVWCTRGGYGAVRTIQRVDPVVFSRTDKVLVGFSDITVIHSALVRSRKVGLHAPMLKHLATRELTSADLKDTFALLRGEEVVSQCRAEAGSRCGTVTAPLVGGNLSVLLSLRGTPVEYKYKGAILFIEDLNEYHYHLDRMVQNFLYSGILSEISGLIVGQMTDMKDGATKFGSSAYEIIAEATKDLNIPILMGYPTGHASEINMPLALGSTATLTVGNGVGELRQKIEE